MEERKGQSMDKVYAGILGLVVGDALGVPVEFQKRGAFRVTDMTGYGTYNQPPGTWSDDSSLTLATLESLGRLGRIDPEDIMQNFVLWLEEGSSPRTARCLMWVWGQGGPSCAMQTGPTHRRAEGRPTWTMGTGR